MSRLSFEAAAEEQSSVDCIFESRVLAGLVCPQALTGLTNSKS